MCGWVGGVGWVAHKILVSAPVPLELILTGFDWVGGWAFGVWVLGRGLTILTNHYFILRINHCRVDLDNSLGEKDIIHLKCLSPFSPEINVTALV